MDRIESLLQTIILFVCGKLNIKIKESSVQSLTQFVKFGLVGLSNTLISYAIHVIVLTVLKPFSWKWDYVAGNLLAFFLSVLWSFYWNNKYVFTREGNQTRSLWKSLLKTYLSYAFSGILLANLLSYIWIEKLHISKYIAPLLNLIITIPLNFILNKKWAFKTKSE